MVCWAQVFLTLANQIPAPRTSASPLPFGRFANSFVYYGLSLNSSDLGGDPYINFLLTALVEFPAYAYIWWSYTAFDRLRPFAISFLTAGVALLLIMAAPPRESVCGAARGWGWGLGVGREGWGRCGGGRVWGREGRVGCLQRGGGGGQGRVGCWEADSVGCRGGQHGVGVRVGCVLEGGFDVSETVG